MSGRGSSGMISGNVKQMAPRGATQQTGGDEPSVFVAAAGGS